MLFLLMQIKTRYVNLIFQIFIYIFFILIFLFNYLGEIVLYATFPTIQRVICSLNSISCSTCWRKLFGEKETCLWLHWCAGIYIYTFFFLTTSEWNPPFHSVPLWFHSILPNLNTNTNTGRSCKGIPESIKILLGFTLLQLTFTHNYKCSIKRR